MNIAEKLKNTPEDTKLYSPAFGEVKFICLYDDKIMTKDITNIQRLFYSNGNFYKDGECMLFPSKDNRNWNNFYICPFKKGDFIVKEYLDGSTFIAIFSHLGGPYEYTINYLCLLSSDGKFKPKLDYGIGNVKEARLATDSEKIELLDAMARNGYCWDEHSMNLKKLKFKVGDTIHREGGYGNYIIKSIAQDRYICENGFFLRFTDQNDWNIAKFDIKSLEHFDKVLTRDRDSEIWSINLFSHYDKVHKMYITIRGAWEQCIPYKEETKHLIGTTNNCPKYYKTW